MSSNTYKEEIIARSWATMNPSWFLDHYFQNAEGGFHVYPGAVRHKQYLDIWEKEGEPDSFTIVSAEVPYEVSPKFGDYSEYVKNNPEGWNTNIAWFERRGLIMLPWHLQFFRAKQDIRTVIGLAATGKTLGIGLMAMFMCATVPGFRFLNVGPTVYQSTQMIKEVRARVSGTRFEKEFLLPGKKGYHEKPYATYYFNNGSTAEFMNVSKNADNIQGWRGDWINTDEAGLINGQDDVGNIELSQMLPGMITRLTGERPDGKPRLGLMTFISMAYDNDTLWELYDYGMSPETAKGYYSQLVLHYENPYITPKQMANVILAIPPGQEDSWLRGRRPVKKGAEFPGQLIDQMISTKQRELADADPASVIEISQRAGVVTYEEKVQAGHTYLMAGDPGMGEPPFRNAPCVQVWDVTKFPLEKAILTCLWWGYANGSITPFLSKFDQYSVIYRVPNSFRGYDSTAAQRHIAELAWSAGEKDVIPLGFDGVKKWEYLNAAKILMSKGLLQIPSGVSGFERQLRGYHLPDKKLAQDIVATLCMACFLMYPLYLEEYPDEEYTTKDEDMARFFAEVSSRDSRPTDRSSARSGSRW